MEIHLLTCDIQSCRSRSIVEALMEHGARSDPAFGGRTDARAHPGANDYA